MEQAIYQELIMRDVDAKDANDAIRQVGEQFFRAGFVEDTYVNAVLEREKNFPTGLQLEGIGIAMPHTDPCHVKHPGICVAHLAHPVVFEHMGEPEVKVEAELLFMMAIKSPDEQVELLQKVLSVFQQPEIVIKFREAKSQEELFQTAKQYIG